MKQFLQFLFLLIFVVSGFSQSKRLVFLEEFTQASCPPCEATTPQLNEAVAANAEKIVQIRYQVWWPGYDPMYLDNTQEVRDRVNYYGVGGVPALFLDGAEEQGNAQTVLPQSAIDDRYAVDAPIKIEVSHTLSDDLSMANVTVKVINEGTSDYVLPADKLRVAFIEEVISYPSPPGSTSLQVFEAVMKQFITGTAGIAVPMIPAGQTWEQTWNDVALPSAVYDYSKIAVVAFVQNDADKSVANSGISHPQVIAEFTDMSVSNSSTLPTGYCEYNFTPKAKVVNVGNTTINAYNVSVLAKGKVLTSKNFATPIEPNQSVSVTLDNAVLPAGSGDLVITVNPTTSSDLAILNNFSAAVNYSKIGDVIANFDNGFESLELGEQPENAIISVPDGSPYSYFAVTQEYTGSADPMGGKGESEKSLRVNLWQWNPANIDANSFMIISDQYVVKAGDKLSFDYAFTNWGGSGDRLKIQISTDCGKTFKDLFNKAGASLITAPALNLDTVFFVPTASQWKSINIDLSTYAGKTSVIRAAVTSDWGDMLYLDNFVISSPSDINELDETESLEVSPVPANTEVNFEINVNTTDNISFTVTDVVGKIIETKNLGNNNTDKFDYNLDVSNYNNGLYLVNFQIGDRRVVKRMMVAH
jgi:thiol-disulfide isomerase/thioredoxin